MAAEAYGDAAPPYVQYSGSQQPHNGQPSIEPEPKPTIRLVKDGTFTKLGDNMPFSMCVRLTSLEDNLPSASLILQGSPYFPTCTSQD
eukprot:4734999-Amphidinium_carterae.1